MRFNKSSEASFIPPELCREGGAEACVVAFDEAGVFVCGRSIVVPFCFKHPSLHGRGDLAIFRMKSFILKRPKEERSKSKKDYSI
jgi:hypothetical protein